jgi:hypothetical protein
MRNAWIAVIGVALALVAVWAIPVPGGAGKIEAETTGIHAGPDGQGSGYDASKVKRSGCCPFSAGGDKEAATKAAPATTADKPDGDTSSDGACPSQSGEGGDTCPSEPSESLVPSPEQGTTNEKLVEDDAPEAPKQQGPGRIV